MSDFDPDDAVDFDASRAVERSLTVGPEVAGERLDKVLATVFSDLSRSRIKALMLEGRVTLDGGLCVDPSRILKAGQAVVLQIPPAVDADPQPENIPLDILFEDEFMLVINKPAGLVVHPGAGNWSGTLVNALLYHCADSLSGIGGVRRPGIVHRLDKETTGLMVVAKSDQAHQALAAQLADRSLSRHYTALVWKVPSLRKGSVSEPIGRHLSNRLKMTVNRRIGKPAVTHFAVQEIYGKAACLLDCKLESGRTHQIRVHMTHIGHPLVGDPLYSLQRNAAESLLRKAGFDEDDQRAILSFPRQALHARRIVFIHPGSGEEMSFTAPLPADLADLIHRFESIG